MMIPGPPPGTNAEDGAAGVERPSSDARESPPTAPRVAAVAAVAYADFAAALKDALRDFHSAGRRDPFDCVVKSCNPPGAALTSRSRRRLETLATAKTGPGVRHPGPCRHNLEVGGAGSEYFIARVLLHHPRAQYLA
jgi:hypothetical protein